MEVVYYGYKMVEILGIECVVFFLGLVNNVGVLG